jgi:hypothetical protein
VALLSGGELLKSATLLFIMKSSIFLAAALAIGAATQAHAILITPVAHNGTTVWTGGNPGLNTGNFNPNAAYISGITGTAGLIELYKSDVNNGSPVESGNATFVSAFQTTFSNSSSDPQNALIDFVGPNGISATPAYLLIKDGNHSPYWYVYNLTAFGWDGVSDIDIQGFWPGSGAISHVSLYGNTTVTKIPPPNTPGVPDGGSTVALLGLGLAALAFIRRKLLA